MVGVDVDYQLQQYRDARDTRSEIEASLPIQGLVQYLQAERILTNGFLAGDTSFRTQLTQSREQVDTFRQKLREEPVVADATNRFGQLASIRAAVDSRTANRKKTQAYYSEAIGALNAAEPAADKATRGDRELRDSLAALQARAEAKEAGSQEISLLGGVLAAGSFRGTNFLDYVELRATRISAMNRFFKLATTTQSDACRSCSPRP
ncbi:nitrate- and nitrite sensing domain-containing protein [Streptomyces cellulosae]|uniref:Nitrate- and nitrite sensing domain-containing protein n=1 Tax=Streptomyces cellulosae TaxID=1968 RepID=A0ABW7YM04_STRCE